jgi:tRNA A58 N-methylase Trm61
MANPTPGVPYVLGDTGAEHARLIRQAAIFEPFTERLLRDAGIGPGQRVLDIGSGVGDVALLAARLVGPTGRIVGVDRDGSALAKARARVTAAGIEHAHFIECDVADVHADTYFDAVVGNVPFGDYAVHDPAMKHQLTRAIHESTILQARKPSSGNA